MEASEVRERRQERKPLIWSSTGGGWRAMFADVGYAYVFKKAGLMDETSTQFSSIATVSGGSWFSTQLFYSQEFYNRTVLASNPDEIEDFVLQWMGTYYNISSTISDEDKEKCSATSEEELADVCELLQKFNFDWAFFVEEMLKAASSAYGDPSFIETLANTESRIEPLQNTDLVIQAALMPNSRLRWKGSGGNLKSTAVYLGYDVDSNSKPEIDLFTVALPLSWVVESAATYFWYGLDDVVESQDSELYLYEELVPIEFSYSDWSPFYLWPGIGGTIQRSTTELLKKSPYKVGTLRAPFGDNPTVVQVAAISSAAGGPYSPAVPSVYAQTCSIPSVAIDEEKMKTVWRVLAGIAIGVVITVTIMFLPMWLFCRKLEDQAKIRKYKCYSRISGVCCGMIIGIIAGVFIGFGSIVVPKFYDSTVDKVYENPNFDSFAVCSQWPNECGNEDAMIIDGWLVDNPAVVSNVGHYQQHLGDDETLKLIITNTNQKWNTSEWTKAQFLQYFSTYFNQDVKPGDFLWGPGYFAPYRSVQIFQEYLDTDGINALIEPIPDSKMTTAVLSGTTIDNPAFNVTSGTRVKILLLNLNEDITTIIVGDELVEKYTQPLADMAKHVASSEVLVERVVDFVSDID